MARAAANVQVGIMLRGEDRASAALNKTAKSTDRVSAALKRTVKQAGAAAMAYVGFNQALSAARGAIDSSIEFSGALAKIQTLIGNNTKRMAELKAGIISVSKETGKPLVDLADATFQIISAFQDQTDTLDKLDIAARAASAGFSDTKSAVDLASLSMRNFGDESAIGMEKVFDLAFITNKLGVTDFPQMAASMGAVIPIAKQLNVSQEELFALYAALTGASGDAAAVTTQLTAVLSGLAAKTDGAAKVVKALKFETAEQMIAEKGLLPALKMVTEETGRSAGAIKTAFGRKQALVGLLPLLTSRTEAYNDALEANAERAGKMAQAFKDAGAGLGAFDRQNKIINARLEAQSVLVGDQLAVHWLEWKMAILDVLELMERFKGFIKGFIKTMYGFARSLIWAGETIGAFLGTLAGSLKEGNLAAVKFFATDRLEAFADVWIGGFKDMAKAFADFRSKTSLRTFGGLGDIIAEMGRVNVMLDLARRRLRKRDAARAAAAKAAAKAAKAAKAAAKAAAAAAAAKAAKAAAAAAKAAAAAQAEADAIQRTQALQLRTQEIMAQGDAAAMARVQLKQIEFQKTIDIETAKQQFANNDIARANAVAAIEANVAAQKAAIHKQTMADKKDEMMQGIGVAMATASAAVDGIGQVMQAEKQMAGVKAILALAEGAFAVAKLGFAGIPQLVQGVFAAAQFALAAGAGGATSPPSTGSAAGASMGGGGSFGAAAGGGSFGSEAGGGSATTVYNFYGTFLGGTPQQLGKAINSAQGSMAGTGL